MSFCFARTLVAAGVVFAAGPAGLAAGGTIVFTGAVTENSCTVQVNGAGTGDGAVALPVVDTTSLGVSGAQKSIAAGTYFNITVSNCANLPTRVVAYFEAGPSVNPVTHALINTGTSNVEVKIYAASGAAVVGSQISPGTASADTPVTNAGTWYYYAGYSPAGGDVRAGTVITSVTYSLVYL